MKTIFLLAALCSLSAEAVNVNDTVVVEQPERVVIVNEDSLLRVQVQGRKDNPQYSYMASLQAVDSNYVSESTMGRDFSYSIGGINQDASRQADNSLELHFSIGFVTAPGSPAAMTVKPLSSGELSIWADICIGLGLPHSRLSVGMGYTWRNFLMTGRQKFYKDDAGNLSIQDLPAGSDPNFSRLKVGYGSFPIRYQYYRKKWGFTFGPVINCNRGHGTLLTRYKLDGVKHKEKQKEVHVNRVTVDLMGTIETQWLKLYVKYSPCNVLDTDYGPKFRSLTFGVFF